MGQATLEQLRALAPLVPCCRTLRKKWGLRQVLANGYRPAELCRRPGVSAPAGGWHWMIESRPGCAKVCEGLCLPPPCHPTQPQRRTPAQALVDEGLTLRSRCVLKREDVACGWLSGVLRHARPTSVRRAGGCRAERPGADCTGGSGGRGGAACFGTEGCWRLPGNAGACCPSRPRSPPSTASL